MLAQLGVHMLYIARDQPNPALLSNKLHVFLLQAPILGFPSFSLGISAGATYDHNVYRILKVWQNSPSNH